MPPLGRGLAVVCLLLVLPLTASGTRLQDNLYGVKMLDDERAWVVGNFGSIFATDDGGKTWRRQRSGTKSPIFSVDFANATQGWAVGKSGLILRTEDGGTTWTPQRTPVAGGKHFFAVAAVDARTAWAVGDWGAIATTRDGGATWVDDSLGVLTLTVDDAPDRNTQLVTDDVILYDVMFVDDRHGFMTGEFGMLLRTADGGATWQRVSTGTEKTLFGVHFITPQRGWLVGIDGIVLRTVDGGDSWDVQRGLTQTGEIGDLSFVEAMANPGLYAVYVSGRQGVVVGESGSLFVSADGGLTWQRRELPDKDRLIWMRDVSFGDGRGLLVGAQGFTARVEAGAVVLSNGTRVTATP